MKRRSPASIFKPWLCGATCCCADTGAISHCEPPLVMSAMAIVNAIAHGLSQRIFARRHVKGLDTFIQASKLLFRLTHQYRTNGRSCPPSACLLLFCAVTKDTSGHAAVTGRRGASVGSRLASAIGRTH